MSSLIPLILKVSLLTFLISGMLAIGTGARNVGATMVPASQPSTDPRAVTMLVVNSMMLLAVLLGASAWLRRQAPQSPTPQPHATP
jgi:putative copper export protein